MDSNHRNPKMTDLQSVPFNHSGTYPLWSWREELNSQPADYKSAALPIELHQQTSLIYVTVCTVLGIWLREEDLNL